MKGLTGEQPASVIAERSAQSLQPGAACYVPPRTGAAICSGTGCVNPVVPFWKGGNSSGALLLSQIAEAQRCSATRVAAENLERAANLNRGLPESQRIANVGAGCLVGPTEIEDTRFQQYFRRRDPAACPPVSVKALNATMPHAQSQGPCVNVIGISRHLP